MKKTRFLAFAMAAVMAAGLAACGSQNTQDQSSSAVSQSTESASQQEISASSETTASSSNSAAQESSAEQESSQTSDTSVQTSESSAQQDASQEAVQYPDFTTGTPWINSSVVGALQPEDQQNLKNDYYQAENYTWLSENQDTVRMNSTMTTGTGTLAERFMTYLFDESKSDELTQNIALLYSQAADGQTLIDEDLAPVQKYLDMIEQASSIEELNAVFASEDYPFDAFITSYICADYMDGNNIVRIDPHFFAVSDSDGAMSYKDVYPIDFSTDTGYSILTSTKDSITSFLKLGYTAADVSDVYANALQLEASYGKDAPYNSEMALADYGTVGSFYNFVTLDELQSRFGNFPVKEILAKEGRDTSETYMVMNIEWLDSFAAAYTEENLDLLKLIAELQLLKETKSYTCLAYADVENTMMTGAYTQAELTDALQETTGYAAISASNTYAHAICAIDKNEIMSQDDIERLTQLTDDLIAQYKETITNNEWLGEESKNAILQKLDSMVLNILEPDSGYIDYTGVQLKSTEEGGTLLENYVTLKKHFKDEMNKLLGTPSKTEFTWQMIAPTEANAFYDQDTNSINIFPGIINDASYRSDMTDEELYGALGTIIGHEISHAFDYAGTQFDYLGKVNTIVSDSDLEQFLAIQQKVIDFYSIITEAENVPVNGKTVVTEAVADLAGLEMIHKLAEKKENFDYDAFYKSFANLYAATQTPAVATMVYSVDTHPANYLRVNVNVQMFDTFYNTYGITEGDGMYLDPDSRITIW